MESAYLNTMVHFLVAFTEFERGGFRGGFGARVDVEDGGESSRSSHHPISTIRIAMNTLHNNRIINRKFVII